MDCAQLFGHDIDIPPCFHDLPFDQWKCRIKVFIKTIDFDLWSIIDNAYIVPIKAKSKWNKKEKKLYAMNVKLLDILLKSIDPHISNDFVSFDSAYKLWKFIEAHHDEMKEGTLAHTKEKKSISIHLSASSSHDRPLGVSPSEVSDSDSDSEITIDELADGYQKLMHAYNKLHKEHVSLKNDHDALLLKFDDVCNDKMIVMHANEKLKNDYEALSSKCQSISHEKIDAMLELEIAKNEIVLLKNHVCSSSSNVVFDNELNIVKDRISCLSSTLNDCVHAHEKLEAMCVKKHSSMPKKHTHHAHMYAKVHKCTICGRKGHVAKFCFDRVQKPVSIGTVVPNASHTHFISHTHSHAPIEHHKHDVVYSCTLCGRKGHLAKFCFDAEKICFQRKNKNVACLKKNKNPHTFQKDSFCAFSRFDSQNAHPLHCTHCGRKGHTKDFCFDRLRAINAPT